MTSGTDAAGGERHTGMMIYLGDNWRPNTAVTCSP